jgi:rubrerythrin
MFEEALLAEQFQDLLTHAQEAERMYAGLAECVEDPELREKVQQVHLDKLRHVRLAERLLEIVD